MCIPLPLLALGFAHSVPLSEHQGQPCMCQLWHQHILVISLPAIYNYHYPGIFIHSSERDTIAIIHVYDLIAEFTLSIIIWLYSNASNIEKKKKTLIFHNSCLISLIFSNIKFLF